MDTGSGGKDAEESTGSSVQVKFEEICQGLNLDKQAQEKAWDSYVRLSEKYGLEVRTGVMWQSCDLFSESSDTMQHVTPHCTLHVRLMFHSIGHL